MQSKPNFRQNVIDLVRSIPTGRVMTYGQIAAICGNARAARIVGGIAHYGDPSLPWQRVVNKSGGLAAGFPGGRPAHKAALELDGIQFDKDGYVINLNNVLWSPENEK